MLNLNLCCCSVVVGLQSAKITHTDITYFLHIYHLTTFNEPAFSTYTVTASPTSEVLLATMLFSLIAEN